MIIAGAVLTSGAGSAQAANRPVQEAPVTAPSPAPSPTKDPSDEPFCNDAIHAAIDSGSADAVVEAAGGGEAFREAVLSGRADGCIALNHPAWAWVVVNKQRPIEPIDYAPNVVQPQLFSAIGAHLTQEAADAVDALAQGAVDAGVGEISLFSGYRGYQDQIDTHNSLVASIGEEAADATSARPGYSEHQLGLAADVVACEGETCGTIYDFGSTPQGQWVDDNAWRYGFIVRYDEAGTPTTGYEAEPWHLRYVGQQIAQAYHDGGYSTYEEFWDLPAAADYS